MAFKCGVCGVAFPKLLCSDCVNQRVATLTSKAKLEESLVHEVEERLKKAEKVRLLQQRKRLLQERIEVVKSMKEKIQSEMVAVRKEKLRREQAVVQRRRKLNEEKKKFTDAKVASHAKATQEKQEAQKLLKEKYAELTKARRKVCARMASVFQFEKLSDVKVKIFNLPFLTSGALEGIPPDLVSTGLGYLAHLLNLSADILGVRLPYPTSFFGSQTTIHDSKLPLFLKEENGTNDPEFVLALQLLNFNIAYLCYTQGIKIDSQHLGQTFLNLHRCLKAPDLGTTTLPSWEFPHTIPLKTEESLHIRSSEFYSSLGDDEWDFVQQPPIPSPSQEADLLHWIKAHKLEAPVRKGSLRG